MLTLDFTSGRVLAFSGTSAQTAVFSTPTTVLLTATHSCWITAAVNPTAAADTAGSAFVPANTPLQIKVPGGQKIAAINDGADGHLSIVPISGVY